MLFLILGLHAAMKLHPRTARQYWVDTIVIDVIAISPRIGEKGVQNLLLKAHILIFSQLW